MHDMVSQDHFRHMNLRSQEQHKFLRKFEKSISTFKRLLTAKLDKVLTSRKSFSIEMLTSLSNFCLIITFVTIYMNCINMYIYLFVAFYYFVPEENLNGRENNYFCHRKIFFSWVSLKFQKY